MLSKIESQSRLSGYASIERVAPERFPVLDSSSRAQNACAFGSERRTFQTYREWLLLVKRRLRFSFAAIDALGSASPALKPGPGSRFACRRKSPVRDSGAQRADTEPPSGSQNLKDLLRSCGPFEAPGFLGNPASNRDSVEEPIFLIAAEPLAGRGYCSDV